MLGARLGFLALWYLLCRLEHQRHCVCVCVSFLMCARVFCFAPVLFYGRLGYVYIPSTVMCRAQTREAVTTIENLLILVNATHMMHHLII